MITLDRLNRKEAIRYLGGAGISLNYRMDVLMDECEKEILKTAEPRFLYVERKAPFDDILLGNDIKKHLEEKEISVNTTTVYRLLDKLCAENIIIKYSDINSDKAVYQYAGEKGHCREHLHLKCIKCGKVMHLDCGFMDELREHIMEEHHFQLQCSGDLLHGLCEECAKNSDF